MLACLTQVKVNFQKRFQLSKIFLPGFPRSRGGRHSNGHVKYRQDQSSGSPGFKIAKVERVSKDESISIEENEMDTSLDNSTGSDVWDNLNEQLR